MTLTDVVPAPEGEAGAGAAQVETRRTCRLCDTEKPIEEFYRVQSGRGGRMAHCIACNNKRPPTKVRMCRNRARSRAYTILAKRHADEYELLYRTEYAAAVREHERLQAGAAGNADAEHARLRPGPVREGESRIDRLDTARCQRCHTHHDAEHECPDCGGITPETAPSEKPWEVRQWANDNGVAVTTRGPLPERVLTAFRAAHPVADQPAGSTDFDQAVVDRILAGDYRLRANRTEKTAVVEAWVASGRSSNELARLTGWKPERYARVTPVKREDVAS